MLQVLATQNIKMPGSQRAHTDKNLQLTFTTQVVFPFSTSKRAPGDRESCKWGDVGGVEKMEENEPGVERKIIVFQFLPTLFPLFFHTHSHFRSIRVLLELIACNACYPRPQPTWCHMLNIWLLANKLSQVQWNRTIFVLQLGHLVFSGKGIYFAKLNYLM